MSRNCPSILAMPIEIVIGIGLAVLVWTPPSFAAEASQAQLRQAHVLANPVLRDNAADSDFLAYMGRLHNSNSNIWVVLYYVFRESIIEQNEDKKYWLSKLKMYNDLAEALSDYLKKLNEAASGLNGKADDPDEKSKGEGVWGDLLDELEEALDRLKARVGSITDLPESETHALMTMVTKDRRFLENARRLGRRVLAIAQTPRLGTKPTFQKDFLPVPPPVPQHVPPPPPRVEPIIPARPPGR